jgi:hypothetical protein
MASRTRRGDRAIFRARLAKAEEFWSVADTAWQQAVQPATIADAVTTLLVHCGIAASDAICCARLGEFATGENHNQAVNLLTAADNESGKHLRVLLGLKSKAAYSHLKVAPDDLTRARRTADSLLRTARRLA